MATIDVFASAFLELSDTPASFAGAGGQFARVNATPDALEFFDLFGAANTWTGTNRFEADVTMAANVLSAADKAHDIGSSTYRFGEIQAARGSFMEGDATAATFAANQGGVVAGYAYGPGTNELLFGQGGYYRPLLLAGNVTTQRAVHTARMQHYGGGSVMLGNVGAFGTNVSKTTEMITGPLCFGSLVGGYAATYQSGVGVARVANYSSGSFLWGYILKQQAGTSVITIPATGRGAFCQGAISGQGTHTLSAAGPGSFVQGYGKGTGACLLESTAAGEGAFAQGFTENTGTIRASAPGSFAQGYAKNSGSIVASGFGSLARGFATSYAITASGRGSFAIGDSAAGPITASAIGSAQIGVGTNSIVGSLQVFTGVRIRANGQVNLQNDSLGLTFGAGSPGDAEAYWDGTDLVIDPDQLSEGNGRLLVGATGDDPLACDSINDGIGGNFKALSGGQHAGPRETVALGVGAATFAIGSNSIEVTGDAGGNSITTITGGFAGQFLVVQFVDALVTIVNDDTHAANTIDLIGAANLTSADDTLVLLFFDGTSWYQAAPAAVN